MMLPQYRKILNAFALKSLLAAPDVPKPSLGVGPAEIMEPVFGRKMLPGRKVRWRPPYDWARKEGHDDYAEGPAVTPDDFPKLNWRGEALG